MHSLRRTSGPFGLVYGNGGAAAAHDAVAGHVPYLSNGQVISQHVSSHMHLITEKVTIQFLTNCSTTPLTDDALRGSAAHDGAQQRRVIR